MRDFDPAPPLVSRLREAGFCFEMFEHPAFFTVSEARSYRAGMEGAHTKNLFLKDKKGRHVLISAHEATEVDLKAMHRRLSDKGLPISGRLSFGSAEKMQALLGVTPGSVTPFALLNDPDRLVPFILDQSLTEFSLVSFHPLRNTATIRMKMQDFVSFMELLGHPPLIMNLSAQADWQN